MYDYYSSKRVTPVGSNIQAVRPYFLKGWKGGEGGVEIIMYDIIIYA